MVSLSPNPAQGFYLFDPVKVGVGLPGMNFALPEMTAASNDAVSTASNCGNSAEDPSKKIRKPYTITKSRESWTEQEHDKFLEALQLFDRDWKKIGAFVGSKTVIQIRSHAQKYFLKVQKNGASEHLPPPRPKRKAVHPYPQKAPKIAAPAISQVAGTFQSSAASVESGYIYRPDSSSVLGNPVTNGAFSSWAYDSLPPINVSQASKDDLGLAGQNDAYNCGYSSSNESIPMAWQTTEFLDQGGHGNPMRVMPDFAQVYSFIGSIFDPCSSDHLTRLKQMNPIDLETVLLLMRNLSINLMSPEFEDLRKLLTSYDVDGKQAKSNGSYNNIGAGKLGNAIPAV